MYFREEETKIQKINIKIEHVDCKKNFKQIEDIFSNENENSEQYESDEENTLKFAIANQKKGLSWFNEDEFVEKERLYSIL